MKQQIVSRPAKANDFDFDFFRLALAVIGEIVGVLNGILALIGGLSNLGGGN